MESQVEEIKSKLNIAEVVGQYAKLERAGRSLRARCPFHKEKTASFYVSPERGTYMCFGCGEKGDVFSFVEKVDGLDFRAALTILAQKAGVVLNNHKPIKGMFEKEHEETLRDICEEACSFFQSQLRLRPDVLAYLHERAVVDESISQWRLGYAPPTWDTLAKHLLSKGFILNDIAKSGVVGESSRKAGELYDRFRGRIMFPMNDNNSRVIAFSGRYFERVLTSQDRDEAKYVNSPETELFRKSRVLYGLDRARQAIRRADCALLVEGQFDLVMSHQSGLPFTIALSGTALTPEHLTLLGRVSKRLVLALDADAAGIRSGLKSAHMALASGFEVKIPLFPQGKDPADIAREDPEALKEAVRSSVTAVEFFVTHFRSVAKDERAYKKSVETHVLPLVAAVESRIEQAHFVSLVAQKLGVPDAAVAAELARTPRINVETYEGITPSPTTHVTTMHRSAHERAAVMLLLHSQKESALYKEVVALLSPERARLLLEENVDHERLVFEVDTLGNDKEQASRMLMHTLKLGLLEEEVQRLSRALRAATDTEAATLLTELSDAKRKQEAFRSAVVDI